MISFFVHRKIATLMLFSAVLLMGFISLSRLKVSLFPDIVFPRLSILTPYPNVAPEEIENLVTRPVEDAVSSVGGVKKIRSRSQEGLSIVDVSFDWGTSLDLATIHLRQKVDLAKSILPQEAGKSIIVAFDPSADPVITLVARPVGVPFENARDYIEKNIRPYLERIPGVASIQLLGGTRREIQVLVDGQKLHAYGLSLERLHQALGASNFNFPAGNVRRGDKEYTVRVAGEFKGSKDIGDVVVSTAESGVPVFLSQIAEIHDGIKERRSATVHNGNEAVILGLKKEPSKNTIETARNIRAALVDINRRFERQVKLEMIQDRSTYISDAISSVRNDAFQGGFLAFLILFFFLKDARSALIVALTIPVAVIATFIPMYARGVSINLMSLGGLSLGLGMLIDNSIVVLEAILAEREMHPEMSAESAAIVGTQRVTQSVIASTLTSAVVFLPIIFVSGIAGEVFRDLALTVTFSSFASFAASLSLIPMLAAVEIRPHSRAGRAFAFANRLGAPVFRFTERIVVGARNRYGGLIGFALLHPAKVIGISFALSLAGGALFLVVKKSLFPEVDQGVVVAEMNLAGGTSLETSSDFHRRIHAFLNANGMSVHAVTNIGFDENDISSRVRGVRKPNFAESTFYVNPSRAKSTEFIEILRRGLSETANVDAHFRIKGDALQELLGSAGSSLVLNIEGRDRSLLRSIASDVLRDMELPDPRFQIRSTAQAEDPEIQIGLDRIRIAASGLTPESVAAVIQTAVQGTVATVFREADTEIDVRLRMAQKDRRSPDDLRRLTLEIPEKGLTPMGSILKITEGYGHPTFLREDQRSLEQVRILFPPGQESVARDLVQKAVFKVENARVRNLTDETKPEIRIERENEETMDSLRNLGFAFLISSVLIYMLLAAQFESLLHPVTLSLAIPMMLSGVSVSLLVTGHSLNITSATGMILLAGIVVNNALILYEYIQERRAETPTALPEEDLARLPGIILESGRERLRPILLTSLTSILGLLPLALGIGDGAELQSPMAVVMIGGMTVSSVLTLVAFPTLFLWMETLRLQGARAALCFVWFLGSKAPEASTPLIQMEPPA